MEFNILNQFISKYKSKHDYDCSSYKFGFIYHRILSYAIENNSEVNAQSPTFKSVLKDLHSFSMRVISRSVTLYLNNLYKSQNMEDKDFPLFFKKYKDEYISQPKNFIEFFNIFKQMLLILNDYYNQVLDNYSYIMGIIENNKSRIIEHFELDKNNFKITDLNLNEGDKHNNGIGTTSFTVHDKTFYMKWKDPNAEINHQFLFEYFKEGVYGDINKHHFKNLCLENLYIQKAIGIQEVTSINQYFHNVGVFLFVTYLISGSDFHYENIISTKNTIVTIDSENIFNIKEDFTVFDTGLLPSFTIREKTLAAFCNNFDGDLDILNYKHNITINGIKVSKQIEKKISNNLNVPLQKGKELIFYAYKDLIVEGFERSYTYFLKNKREIVNLIKSLFTDVQTRIIKKATYVYSDAIWSSYTPKLLTGFQFRQEFFKTLNIFDQQEINYLLKGNIPHITRKIEVSNNMFDKFNNEDKNKQIRFITEAYILEYIRNNKLDNNKDINNTDIDMERIFSWCYQNLLNKGFLDNGAINWLEIIERGNESYKDYQLDLMPETIYYGKMGIFLFLLKYGQHYKIESHDKYEFLNQIHDFIKQYLKEIKTSPDIQNGIIDGAAGLLYLIREYSHEGTNLEKDMIDLAVFLSNNSKNDIAFDLISGSIGLLKILITMYEDDTLFPFKNTLLSCIVSVKNHLIANYYTNSAVCGWPSKGGLQSDINLGYSHGLAGFLPVIYKCANLLKDDNLHHIVNQALEFLLSQNNRKGKNWPCSINNNKELVNWCHGAPGILLCLIELFNYGYTKINLEPIIMNNLPILLETEKESISLCHGRFGNNFIGIYIAHSLNNEVYYQEFYKRIMADFKYYFTEDKIYSMNKSFMTGYSGILYIYLKCKELNIIKSNETLLPI